MAILQMDVNFYEYHQKSYGCSFNHLGDFCLMPTKLSDLVNSMKNGINRKWNQATIEQLPSEVSRQSFQNALIFRA